MIQNLLASQTTQNILEENHLIILQMKERKKVLVLKERKNLKVEMIDLKVLHSKNIVKKELKSKTF